MYRKNFKNPDSLDFLGFFTYAFLRYSTTRIYTDKLNECIFTNRN